MTEHILRPRTPDRKVTVGWDPALATFFCKVIDTKHDKLIDFLGNKEREIIDVVDLRKRVHRYGYFNQELGDKLRADRDAGRAAS